MLDYLLKPVEADILNNSLRKALAIVQENLIPVPEESATLQGGKPDASQTAPAVAPQPEESAGTPPCLKDTYVRKAIAYIEENLMNNVTRESVSEQVHITPDHLDRLFREQVGMSAFRYIVWKKIELSKQLLSTTDLPIGTIASDLGYCNLSNFSSAFRKLCNMTPAEYRKSV